MNEQEAFEQFGRFIEVFKSMDADLRGGVIEFLLGADEILSEGEKKNEGND